MIYGEVTTLGSEQLSMTPAEANELLLVNSGQAGLQATGEGWPALLGLMAAAEQLTTPNPIQPELVYAFLAEELLRDIPASMEAALLETAAAPSLAGMIFGEHEGSALLAEAVERGFVRVEAGRYSMHPLFQEFLCRKLREKPDEASITHRLTTQLLDNREWDAAFEAGKKFRHGDLLQRLLEEAGFATLEEGRLETVTRWLRTTREWIRVSPVMDLIQACVSAHRANYEHAQSLAVDAAQRLGPDHPLYPRAMETAASSSYLSDRPDQAVRFYREARATARDAHDRREALLGLLGTTIEWELGNRVDEQVILRELLETATPDPESTFRVAIAEMYYAVNRGPVWAGLERARQVEHLSAAVRNLRIVSSFFATHSSLLTLSGQYAAAREAARVALASAQTARLAFAVPLIHIRLAASEIGLANYTAVRQLVQLLRAAGSKRDEPYLRAQAALHEARLLICQNMAYAAVQVIENHPTADVSPQLREELTAYHAVALACAGNRDEAEGLAISILQGAPSLEAHGLATAAIAVAGLDTSHEQARREHMLTFCSDTGSIDGAICALRGSTLLWKSLEQTLKSSEATRIIAEHVLRAAARVDDRPATSGYHAIEGQLSRREQDVLEQLEHGLSNKQIAKALFISEVTVKAHLRHIYAKIGVNSRTQAVLWAQAARGSGDL
jgi:ATP/maltotriose-dependent transcriptional regulator MalT